MPSITLHYITSMCTPTCNRTPSLRALLTHNSSRPSTQIARAGGESVHTLISSLSLSCLLHNFIHVVEIDEGLQWLLLTAVAFCAGSCAGVPSS